jgi:nicotinamide mononucleotide transporter
MSIYGLYCWKFSRTQKGGNEFHCIAPRLAIKLGIIGFILFITITGFLIRYTDSTIPVPDALVATLSIIATWMTAKKIIECWYPWIFVNFFAIGLYLYQQLYPTAILYVAYGILSVVGLIEWRKSLQKK